MEMVTRESVAIRSYAKMYPKRGPPDGERLLDICSRMHQVH